jgi:hypothetical protein
MVLFEDGLVLSRVHKIWQKKNWCSFMIMTMKIAEVISVCIFGKFQRENVYLDKERNYTSQMSTPFKNNCKICISLAALC